MALIPPRWSAPKEKRLLKFMPAQAVLYSLATKIDSRFVDSATNVDMITGIGFGKSLGGAHAYRDICLSRPDDVTCIYGPSYPTLERSTLHTLNQVIDREKDIESWNLSKNIITWANGHISHIFPMDQERKIDAARGPTYSAAWGDERSLCPKLAFDVITGRLRSSDYPLVHYGTGTPKGFDWIYYLHKVDHKGDPDYYIINSERFNVSTFHNPFTPKKYKDLVFKQYGNTRFARQELWGEFTASSGLVWDFTMGRVRALPKNLKFDIVFGLIDWGFSDPFAIQITGLVKSPRDFDLWTFDEVYEVRLTPDQMAEHVRRLQQKHNVSTWLADSARPDLIAHVQTKTGIPVYPTSKEPIPTGISRVAALLSQNRWHWTPACSAAIDEHMKYHYPLGKDGKPKGEVPVDKDNHTCFVAGTLIETDKGPTPIEDVQVGTMVLSSDGRYHRVTHQDMTNPGAEVYKIMFSDGRILMATGNHPIWIEGKGWTRVDAMRYADIVITLRDITWHQARQSYLMGSNTLDILTQNDGMIGFITSLKGLAKSLLGTFIGSSSRNTTDQSLRVSMYTTQMGTPSTTTSQILNSLRRKATSLCIVKRGSQIPSGMQKIKSYWLKSGQKQPNGMVLKRVLSGILRTLKKSVPCVSLSNTYAKTAAKNLNMWQQDQSLDSAQIIASRHGEKRVASTMLKGHVLSVAMNSLLTSIAKLRHVHAPVKLVSIKKQGKKAVYNLTVDKSHNYFANGILVHNCDNSRYLADFLAQTGYISNIVGDYQMEDHATMGSSGYDGLF